MTSSATINLSGSAGPMSPGVQHYNQGDHQDVYRDHDQGGHHGQGHQDQGGHHGQVFHISNNQISHVEEPVRQIIAPGPKLAFSASNYPPNVQQQQYQQQFQIQQQSQPQIQFQPQQQYQIQQQFQPQSQQFQVQHQPHQNIYEQAQYQPHEQYQQQYSQPQQQMQYQPIQMTNIHPQMTIQSRDTKKAPVFEAPISKMQIVKKNQSAPPKQTAQNVQQSFRSSRSGSFATLDEITDPPHFIKHPDQQQATSDGAPFSLTARVIPAGDPNLTVQWYKDGQPLSAGSRFNTSFERGFAVLEILYTFKEDSGEYSCVAKNNYGMDQTTPSILKVAADANVVLKSHLPREMAANIAAMDASLNAQKILNDHYEKPMHPPKFIRPMHGLFNLKEGQSVHLETVFIPIDDSTLSIEWYKNGRPLNNGSRFNMISDRGFAILDIVGLILEDIGDYFCVARNFVGQAQSNIAKLKVSAEASVVTTSQLPKESVKQLEALDSNLLDDQTRPDFRYEETEEVESPPHFDIKPVDAVVEEGNPAKFLIKVSGYPRPSIQWFLNSSSAVSTTTQRVYNDGSISYFEFNRCKHVGQNHILVVLKNKLGEATANATLTVMGSTHYRSELKCIEHENPFRKLTTLKKVEVSSELKNAFHKHKPQPVEPNKLGAESMVKVNQNRSYESAVAENLYTNVQAKLRRSDRPTYAGAININPQHSEIAMSEFTSERYTNVAPVPSVQPMMQSTEMVFSLNRSNFVEDQNFADFNLED